MGWHVFGGLTGFVYTIRPLIKLSINSYHFLTLALGSIIVPVVHKGKRVTVDKIIEPQFCVWVFEKVATRLAKTVVVFLEV